MKARLTHALSEAMTSSPLRNARFRLFYIGSIGTALGYTMQTTIAAWVMATLTTSELMVALVQTASTAPALLFGLIAGALADIVDRRRLILATQWLLLVGHCHAGASPRWPASSARGPAARAHLSGRCRPEPVPSGAGGQHQ